MGFQKLNRFHKAFSGDGHDQINGIKIDFAIKTSGQVGIRICSRVKPVATRTAEPAVFCAASRFKRQGADNQINIDLIAQPS
jgi:hypothetical protein